MRKPGRFSRVACVHYLSHADQILSGDKDIAASVVPEYAQPWNKQVERRVVRKIDLILIPIMWIGYGLVYYDKAILGAASVFGLTTDLKLKVIVNASTRPPQVSTTRLSWATSLFYFGMLAGVGPLTYLFQRFHLGRTIGVAVIAWGAIEMCTAGVTTYRGLWVQRFFLGFAESIMPTAFMVIISGYYTEKERSVQGAKSAVHRVPINSGGYRGVEGSLCNRESSLFALGR